MLIRLMLLIMALMGISCNKEDSSHFQGYVEAEDIYLASPYSGTLIKLDVRRGQVVKKGYLIFQLDPNPETLILKEDEAQYEQAQQILEDLQKPMREPEIASIKAKIEMINAKLKLSKLQVTRFYQLYQKQAISKTEVDKEVANFEELQQAKIQQEADLNLAKMGSRNDQIDAQAAQVMALKAKVSQGKWQLAQKSVYAPKDGIIFDTYFREGEFVGSHQAVASLLTPENVRVEFYVSEIELAKIHLGKQIDINCEACSSNYRGVISYISPQAEFIPPLVYSRENKDKLVFRIKANVNAANTLKPGQPVTVSIHNGS